MTRRFVSFIAAGTLAVAATFTLTGTASAATGCTGINHQPIPDALCSQNGGHPAVQTDPHAHGSQWHPSAAQLGRCMIDVGSKAKGPDWEADAGGAALGVVQCGLDLIP